MPAVKFDRILVAIANPSVGMNKAVRRASVLGDFGFRLHGPKRAANDTSALACALFQSFGINQRNPSAKILNDACALQPHRDLGNGLSPDIEEHADSFLSNEYRIAVGLIKGARQKITNSLLDAVMLVAYPELRGLSEQGEQIAQQQTL